MSPWKLPTALLLVVVSGVAAPGCRGWTSDQPPVHINPNMDTQPKLMPYRESDFFADGRAMQMPVDGTVARTLSGDSERDADYLAVDDHYYRGVVNGQVVDTLPSELSASEELLERGRERYNIYCAPCHAQHGTGAGLVAARLTIKPPTFHDELRQKRPLGHFFRIMTHGSPLPEARSAPDAPLNMPSYAMQVPVRDRWAIALYVRALQRVAKGGALPPAEPMTISAAAATATPSVAPGQPAEITSASPSGGGAEPAAERPGAKAPTVGTERPAPATPTASPTPNPPTPSEGAEVQQ